MCADRALFGTPALAGGQPCGPAQLRFGRMSGLVAETCQQLANDLLLVLPMPSQRSSSSSARRAREHLDLIVPTRTPSAAAASSSVRPEQVAEQQRLALLGGKRGERLSSLEQEVVVLRHACLGFDAAAALALDVGGLVRRDADEPRPEAVRAAQAWQPAPGCGQRFLQRIVRVALVPQFDAQIAVQPRAVPDDERLERSGAPQLGPPHELGVVVLAAKRGSSRFACSLRWSHHSVVAPYAGKVPGMESLRVNGEREPLGRPLAERVPRR